KRKTGANPGPSQTMLEISVKDSGIGIAEEKLPSIFETFFQIEQTDPTLKRQGSGLGLSICKRLTDLMDGTIQVKSIIGKGTEFIVTIPFGLPHKMSSETMIEPLD